MGALFEWIQKNFTAYQVVMIVLAAQGSYLFYLGRIDHVPVSVIDELKSDISTMRSEIGDMKKGLAGMKLQSQFNHSETEAHKSADSIFALQEHMDEETAKHLLISEFERVRMKELKEINETQTREVIRLENLGANQ